MTDDIHLAFAHPGERAAATSREGTPLDRISLRDHIVEADIGAFQQERGLIQRLRFNVVVEVALLTAPVDDDVDRILSYDRVTEAIEAALAEDRLNLLETLAERVALGILAAPQAMRTFVRIEKLDRGPGALGVEIVRSRDAAEPNPAQASVPHPLVVYLSNDAIAAPDLSTRLDQLAADGVPLVLCVGAADCPAPQTSIAMAQRRIDLLAIEQNAWVLAGRDKRCIVVGTRTELDWAMRHGQISVWAPSKIVLDAVDGPSASPSDALALVAWFAKQMGAVELRVIGAEGPDAEVPVRIESL
ncbi:dihydroneopterin aldolase [Flavimaricola marinus]|uniref:dihydroneopterin aldolase n=1 Tax=Flavimaricola marinus TaxID=1819565 RepID=A0A238LG97_9RHOB|nr:dihydroneopterin aldolase [Flavimaricola marinus]SMY08661.1 bifunctional dihydroneopterin aldolase/dihydroneopterin triphosphate 2'-epimerase [Flavimaricola marinus]